MPANRVGATRGRSAPIARSRESVGFRTSGSTSASWRQARRWGCTTARAARKAFLVLAGECTLIVEGEERRLVTWDFFYCVPETEHIIVAAGQQSAVVLAVGARGRGVGGGIVYTVCKAAARYGASVARETAKSAAAYAKARAGLPRSKWVKYRSGWLPDTD
jgi:hypothetical protein